MRLCLNNNDCWNIAEVWFAVGSFTDIEALVWKICSVDIESSAPLLESLAARAWGWNWVWSWDRNSYWIRIKDDRAWSRIKDTQWAVPSVVAPIDQ
jgi:hypothetical protein